MPKSDRPAAIVLLSAGLDSAYNLMRAREQFKVALVLTFDYGQKAARREVERSVSLALEFDLPHQIVDLSWFSSFTQSSLIGEGQVPSGGAIEIDNLTRSRETAKNVWVPNRNGIFLNIAAGFAEGLGARYVVPGFNSEEAQTFPDNSGAFLRSLDACWSFSTEGRVEAFCFSTEMNKAEIVADAKGKLPFGRLWPCYLAGETWCGQCESCQRFRRALYANGFSFDDLNAPL